MCNGSGEAYLHGVVVTCGFEEVYHIICKATLSCLGAWGRYVLLFMDDLLAAVTKLKRERERMEGEDGNGNI